MNYLFTFYAVTIRKHVRVFMNFTRMVPVFLFFVCVFWIPLTFRPSGGLISLFYVLLSLLTPSGLVLGILRALSYTFSVHVPGEIFSKQVLGMRAFRLQAP